MGLREAAQQALKVLERADNISGYGNNRKAIAALRAALADTQDWDELETLRQSLREHMSEIKRLREAGWHAYYALREINSPLFVSEITRIGAAMSGLRAALSEDAMQRLTDEQQMIERGTKAWAGVPNATAWVEELRGNEPVTNFHGLEHARAAAISNLLAHFGITSADSNVNVAYLHKQLDDFLTAAIGCSNGGDKLTRHLKKVEECEYPRCLSSSGCERQCPAFPRCKDADTGETSDVPETNFGNIAQSTDSTGADQSEDALEMVATSQESRQVEPVAYVKGYSKGRCIIEAVDPDWLLPVGMALYRLPPKREPLTEKQIKAIYDALPKKYTLAMFARAIEQAHDIGGEE